MRANTLRSGTGRRLALAFAALIALYVAAESFALQGFRDISQGLQRTQARVDGMRLALDLASAVRDVYAHEAHTIILGNDTHLGMHSAAQARVLELVAEMRRHVERPDEQAWVSEIASESALLDQIFSQRIVPAVLAHQTAAAHDEHARALAVVGIIQSDTDRLARRFDESVRDLDALVRTAKQRAVGWILLSLVAAPLFAFGVAIYIARRVALPVAQLHAGAQRLATGDLETRIQVADRDELGDLAQQFNTMTAALKEHQLKLLHSERLASVGRLAAGVAHEINNPLGVILGYTRLLKKQAAGSLAEDLAIIEEETVRCQEIVEGLLELSRPVQIERQPVDLRALCDEVTDRLTESRSAGVKVSVTGAGRAAGAAHKLRQVLLNLVRNAMEAAAPEGQVAVNVTMREDLAEVVVSDSGPGLSAEAREHLFEPFFTTKRRGTGLGLATAQAIARAHGGEIAVQPQAQGGAVFVLRIPSTSSLGES